MTRTIQGWARTTPPPLSRRARRAQHEVVWWLVYLTVLLAGLAIGMMALQRIYFQPYFGFAWGCYVLLMAAWIWYPRLSLGAMLALTLTGDIVTVWWFPFAKNLSSSESIMYVSDAVSVSPLEIMLVWAVAVTLYKNVSSTGRLLRTTPLLYPFLVLGVFTLLGFVRGMSSGADLRAAIFEVRPLILLPLLYVLVVNVCRSRQDYRRLMWVALAAITLQALLSLQYLSRLSATERNALESLNEHGAAIGANLVLMALVASLAYRQVNWTIRITLLAASIPITWVYLIAQRRAAIVALVGAFVLFGFMLFWRQCRTFWKVIPICAVVAIGYLGAFWNSEMSAGFPAQAIKTVLAPEEASAEDQSSDFYRLLETLNLSATVRSSPVLGIGFGQPFLRPFPLPDIGVFEFNAYVPHNSFIWIWTKTGFGGFVALVYIVGRSMMQGASRARAAPDGDDAVVALTGVLFVAMYVIFLYVDIGWEPRNAFLFALSLGLCTGPIGARYGENPNDDTASSNDPRISSGRDRLLVL